MSWKVETLLTNRLKIRADCNLESDDYNDLILVEDKAQELYELGVLSKIESRILNMYADGDSLSEICKDVSIGKRTIILIFRRACEKIAFSLGGDFTDFGTVSEMAEKYKLDQEHLDNLVNYINSEYKHKLSRAKK